jgi:hypothetical protein
MVDLYCSKAGEQRGAVSISPSPLRQIANGGQPRLVRTTAFQFFHTVLEVPNSLAQFLDCTVEVSCCLIEVVSLLGTARICPCARYAH